MVTQDYCRKEGEAYAMAVIQVHCGTEGGAEAPHALVWMIFDCRLQKLWIQLKQKEHSFFKKHCCKSKVNAGHVANSVVQLCSQIPCFWSAHFPVLSYAELVGNLYRSSWLHKQKQHPKGKWDFLFLGLFRNVNQVLKVLWVYWPELGHMADANSVTCEVHWIDLGSIRWKLISEFGGTIISWSTWLPEAPTQNWIWFGKEGMSFVESGVCIWDRQK